MMNFRKIKIKIKLVQENLVLFYQDENQRKKNKNKQNKNPCKNYFSMFFSNCWIFLKKCFGCTRYTNKNTKSKNHTFVSFNNEKKRPSSAKVELDKVLGGNSSETKLFASTNPYSSSFNNPSSS
mmetsp:Transcript_5785/g.7510  ORF Transcript_5785/g.7510 Transcript_5785/m.7510 type:complete len:124 (+) Transcript_5785:32-403(+)